MSLVKDYDGYKENYIEDDDKKVNIDRWFVILSTIFLFCMFISDLSYSYINIEACQTKTDPSLSLTLNMWLRVNGIYGILYYSVMMFIYFYIRSDTFREKIQKGNNYENKYRYGDDVIFIYRLMLIFLTSIGVLWSIIGTYSFFHYFWDTCDSYAIIIYMWLRTIICLICYIILVPLAPYYIVIKL